MTERQLTLMAVHAHPDDEATSTGGTLARYAAEGVRTVLVVCTDGAQGDGPDGVKPGAAGHDPGAVARLREGELAASCAALKISAVEKLGYADSGMMGWATNDAPHAFWNTPVEEAAGRLAALMEHYRPDVVVTYDENGFYGHPDHIQAHRITMAAAEQTGIPAKIYWTTMPRSALPEFAAAMRELGADWDEPDDAEQTTAEPEIGLPDDQITTWIDVSAHLDAKHKAFEAHASQVDNIIFLRLPDDLFARFMSTETYLRVRDHTGAQLPEKDLFAGLR
jgi:N-acetyl-1-D-myo-inositol-2-amino-2-deoxy-alpha-D-glucopyranoside deacetylase